MGKYGYLKDEKAFVNWLRSSQRTVWNKHPIKMQKLELGKIKIPTPTGRFIWGAICERCGKKYKMADIEVNHKKQVGKNLSLDTFPAYCKNLHVVSLEDLELLCKGCHSIITYAERMDIDLEAAEIEKKVIKFKNKTAEQQKAGLLKLGISPASTQIGRVEQARNYLRSLK